MDKNELKHYGVIGMKWGVLRSKMKSGSLDKYAKKAAKYDKKSAVYTKKSERVHSKYDLGRSNRAATKAAKFNKKAANVQKKIVKSDDNLKKVLLEKQAAKYSYKAANKQIKANRISKTKGYGIRAMKLSVKSDKVALKAKKARMKLANNKAYISMTNRKVSSLTGDKKEKVNDFMKKIGA